MVWFWFFVLYSFFGFLLEVVFAHVTRSRPDRKCLLVLPLCPVYGLGACAILLLAPAAGGRPALLFLLGSGAATVVEYAMAVWYERGLGVSFWDYTDLPGNIQGRVCLPFSIVWGVLSLPLVYWVHPALAPFLAAIPLPVTWMAFVTVGADILLSGVMLRRTGDRDCLKWYAA